MQYLTPNSYYNPSFGIKMVSNRTLAEIRDYAANLGKEHKIDEVLENIDKIRPETLIAIDVCYTKNIPTVVFSRYERSLDAKTGLFTGDYFLRSQIDFENTNKKNMNPIKFAYEKLIKLGNDAPNNNLFKKIVFDKEFNPRKERLF